jgi:hypothetical protein
VADFEDGDGATGIVHFIDHPVVPLADTIEVWVADLFTTPGPGLTGETLNALHNPSEQVTRNSTEIAFRAAGEFDPIQSKPSSVKTSSFAKATEDRPAGAAG